MINHSLKPLFFIALFISAICSGQENWDKEKGLLKLKEEINKVILWEVK